ncbi:aromatic amino acid ammonia-lyase [Nocardia sp. NPDC051900]|uniref:aromatic amino acid ammonia-lyase n=1 Tax=Nocardia sp. NPDC051900 TaxID=3364326 RepID=UPI0037872734
MLEQVNDPVEIRIADDALKRVDACHVFLLDRIAAGVDIYGTTTGFGPLVVFSGRRDAADQCNNVVGHLSAGQGEDLPPHVVRATVLTRLWSLARGHSGISPGVLPALVAMLGTQFAPAVPRVGSVGASGDLIPLAYVARALRGENSAYLSGIRMPAGDALRSAGLTPLVLDGRDALALVNGTSLTAAAAGLAVMSVRRSHLVAMMLTALLADVLGSDPGFLADELLDAFGHSQARAAAGRMRQFLDGTAPTGTRPLQEPYSIRCTPQLLGAVGTSIEHVEHVVVDDLNGISDNPMFFPEKGAVVHGGNFFGQPVAFAADLLSVSTVQVGNLAERQLDLLVDPHRNGGLNPMLATKPGEQHGVQGVQLAATAIVAAMRRAAVPASMQSLPTNLHNQDVVPFGTQAALNALDLAGSLRLLHGSLAVALRQAAHIGGRRPTSPACAAILDRLIDLVPAIDPDRPLDADVRSAADLLDTIADECTDLGYQR